MQNKDNNKIAMARRESKEAGLAEGFQKGEQKGKLEERKLPWNMARSK